MLGLRWAYHGPVCALREFQAPKEKPSSTTGGSEAPDALWSVRSASELRSANQVATPSPAGTKNRKAKPRCWLKLSS